MVGGWNCEHDLCECVLLILAGISLVKKGLHHLSPVLSVYRFIEWMYPSGGGEENVESAALGIIILWTTW